MAELAGQAVQAPLERGVCGVAQGIDHAPRAHQRLDPAAQGVIDQVPPQKTVGDQAVQAGGAGPHWGAANIAQDVVDRSIEPMTLSSDWDPEWGSGPLYKVTWLACGHTIARLA